jgi:hypothetical protein
LGTLICNVLHSYQLDKWDPQLSGAEEEIVPSDGDAPQRSGLSRLFLARVKEVRSNTDGLLPLVYHNGQYSTIRRTDGL